MNTQARVHPQIVSQSDALYRSLRQLVYAIGSCDFRNDGAIIPPNTMTAIRLTRSVRLATELVSQLETSMGK